MANSSGISAIPQRQPVLVLVHSDHFVEVFGPRNIDVKVLDFPKVNTDSAVILAAQYIDLTIPMNYREIYWPDCRRAMHMPRVVTPSSIVATQRDIDLLRAIQEIKPAMQRWAL